MDKEKRSRGSRRKGDRGVRERDMGAKIMWEGKEEEEGADAWFKMGGEN